MSAISSVNCSSAIHISYLNSKVEYCMAELSWCVRPSGGEIYEALMLDLTILSCSVLVAPGVETSLKS